MLKKGYVDAADIAIKVLEGDLPGAEALFDSFAQEHCTWECLWLRDRAAYFCGSDWPARRPHVLNQEI